MIFPYVALVFFVGGLLFLIVDAATETNELFVLGAWFLAVFAITSIAGHFESLEVNRKLTQELKEIKQVCLRVGIATSTPKIMVEHTGFKWNLPELAEKQMEEGEDE